MTLVIASKSDLGRVTRELASHPEWEYHTHAGDNGEIVIDVDTHETRA
jgi:hypothetical protein